MTGPAGDTVAAILARTGVRECSGLEPESQTHLNLGNWPVPLADLGPISLFTELRSLRLSDSEVKDLTPVAHLRHLQVLHLDHTRFGDLEQLEHFPLLEELWLDSTPTTDLAPLASLGRLRVLGLTSTGVLDLSALGSLAALEVLDLSGTSVSDLGPLGATSSLRALGLRETRVRDLGPITSHRGLVYLDASGARLTDATPLVSLPSLQALDLSHNHLRTLPSLPAPLEEYRLDGNPLPPDACPREPALQAQACLALTRQQTGDFTALCLGEHELPFPDRVTLDTLRSVLGVENCAELGSRLGGQLDLRGSPVPSLTLFRSTPEVTALLVDPAEIGRDDCEGRTGALAAARSLCDSSLAPQDLPPVDPQFQALCSAPPDRGIAHTLDRLQAATGTRSCDALGASLAVRTRLELTKAGLTTLEPLRYFPNLRELYLDYNQLQGLEPLRSLHNLEVLWLDDNQVEDLSPLAELDHLLWLGLGDNRIADISSLSGLTRLRHLWLGGNRVTDLTPLQSLRSLRKLHLANNTIRSVEALKDLTSLESLYLADNHVEDFRPLGRLLGLELLNSGLDLDESPLEANRWLLAHNPIQHCPEEGPLAIRFACEAARSPQVGGMPGPRNR